VTEVTLRDAVTEDAVCPSVLAMPVFPDTGATQRSRPAIAREVLSGDSEAVFSQALAHPRARMICVERTGHPLGFARVTLGAADALAPAGAEAELLRPTT
jgi:hypothetical protein